MARVTCHMSVSVDGYAAGPDQSRDDPLGRGGLALHQWHLNMDDQSDPVDLRMRDALLGERGAYIMGRNMFGPIRGDWGEEDWRGWWGPEPPYHAPVFVLTHHARDPVEMDGGTTFHFVTDGFESALEQARAVAGDLDIDVAGGASTVQQALRAGAIDELVLDVAPLILGDGERLLDEVPAVALEVVEVAGSPLATHVRYRVNAASR
jgi:dihydrofolate reductase